MCFTPKVSLSTALFEFLVFAYIFVRYNKSRVARYVALFVLLLGFYQFTEYMLCTTDDFKTWGKFGFITYTILPAAGLSFVLDYAKKRSNIPYIYIPTAVFILIALINPNFVATGTCHSWFISVKTYFTSFSQYTIPTLTYWLYYFSYLTLCCIFLAQEIKNKKRKPPITYYLLLITIIATIVPPAILVVVFPSLDILFPSIYCQFAILFAVMALIGVHVDGKRLK